MDPTTPTQPGSLANAAGRKPWRWALQVLITAVLSMALVTGTALIPASAAAPTLSVEKPETPHFTALSVEDKGVATDKVTRTIRFVMPTAEYKKKARGYDAWFVFATPDGAHLEHETIQDDELWTMTLPAGDPASVARATDQAFASSGNRFEIVHDTIDGDPLRTLLTVKNTLNCGDICDDPKKIRIDTVDEADWDVVGDETGAYEGDTYVQRFRIPTPLIVVATTRLHEDGTGEIAYAYTVAKGIDEQAGAEIAEWVRTDPSLPEPVRTEKGGSVTYTMTIPFENGGTNEQLRRYAPREDVTQPGSLTITDGDGLLKKRADFDVPLVNPLPLQFFNEEKLTWVIELPRGYEIDPDSIDLHHNEIASPDSLDPRMRSKVTAKENRVVIENATDILRSPETARFAGTAEGRDWGPVARIGGAGLIVLLLAAVGLVTLLVVMRRRRARRNPSAA